MSKTEVPRFDEEGYMVGTGTVDAEPPRIVYGFCGQSEPNSRYCRDLWPDIDGYARYLANKRGMGTIPTDEDYLAVGSYIHNQAEEIHRSIR